MPNQRTTSLLLILVLLLSFRTPPLTWAASFTALTLTLNNSTANAVAVTHTVQFTVATGEVLQQIHFRYATTSGGTSKPSSLGLGNASLGALTGLGENWNLDTGGAASGLLILTRATPVPLESGTNASVALQNITNSAINDCEPANSDLTDTCYLAVTSYSDEGVTVVDSGETTYTVRADPTLSLTLEGVASEETHNGITTTVSSSGLNLAFGRLKARTPQYMAHRLTVSTNAPHGYRVYLRWHNGLRGSYTDGEIDPFGATNASWETPQPWQSPDGNTPNADTGWFGANTSDTRVTHWESNTQGKFGPVSAIPHVVAQSDGPDEAGTTVYVSYALEVNDAQPSDYYSGTIEYSVQPTY
jgi:hypothetical protein